MLARVVNAASHKRCDCASASLRSQSRGLLIFGLGSRWRRGLHRTGALLYIDNKNADPNRLRAAFIMLIMRAATEHGLEEGRQRFSHQKFAADTFIASFMCHTFGWFGRSKRLVLDI